MARSLALAQEQTTKTQLARPPLRLPVFKILIYLLLTAGALVFAMPFLWMLFTSLMTPNEVARGAFIPRSELIGFHKISNEDLERPLVEFLYADSTLTFNGTGVRLEFEANRKGGVLD